ncbi:MAG TPA: sugar ABC transporter permease [bacterium]|nr:sugar ABC transporter permease [bacterium]
MSETPATGAPARRRGRVADRPRLLGWLFLGPTLLYIFGLVGMPLVLSITYSLTNVTVTATDFGWRGLDHYRAVTLSQTFWTAFKNTFIIAIGSQVVVAVFSLVLALALARRFPGKWFVRLLILLPFVAPISLGSIGWLWMFDSIYSIINWTLQHWGILGPGQWLYWLGEPHLALLSIILVQIWRTLPLATVIVMAGLGSIPQDIHDAAQMDGASVWRHHTRITIPLLTPIVMVAVLFGLVFTFSDMVVIFVLTRGGPFDSTHNLASWAFFAGIQGGDLGEGAAISLFLFPLLALTAIAMLRVARKAEVT